MAKVKNAIRWLKCRMKPQGVIWPTFKHSAANTGKVLAIAGSAAAIFALADLVIATVLRAII